MALTTMARSSLIWRPLLDSDEQDQTGGNYKWVKNDVINDWSEDNDCIVAPRALSKQFERPSFLEILHPTETKAMKDASPLLIKNQEI